MLVILQYKEIEKYLERKEVATLLKQLKVTKKKKRR